MSDNRTPRGVDEGGSVVSETPRRQMTAMQKIGIAGLLAVVFVGFIWISQLTKKTQEAKQPDVSLAGGGAFQPAPQAPPAPPPPTTLPMPAASPAAALFAPPQQHEMTPAESPIFAFMGGGGGPAEPPLPSPSPASLLKGPGGPLGAADNALSTRLKPTSLTGSKARLLPHPDMLVTQGTVIPCTLQTAIDTQLAGFVKCVLPEAVRSTTGNVTLLDRGTIVVGEIQSGLMRGQNRVFVLWDRAETPDHAVIELSSPGTDELGRSGLPGQVNNHFWERFGGAILLSVVQGGLQTGTALAANSGGSNGTFFNSFQSNGSNVADTALQATINIPPTLEKNQGDNIAIFVAKDLDFSDVYNLRVTGAAYAQ
jgi:type IV secretion system protein VirB10